MIIDLLCTFLLVGLYVVCWPVGIVGLIMSAGLFCVSEAVRRCDIANSFAI